MSRPRSLLDEGVLSLLGPLLIFLGGVRACGPGRGRAARMKAARRAVERLKNGRGG